MLVRKGKEKRRHYPENILRKVKIELDIKILKSVMCSIVFQFTKGIRATEQTSLKEILLD